MSIRVLHVADLHYAPKHLDQVDRCFGYAVEHAIEHCADVAVIAGDSFDSTMGIHEPAYAAYLSRIIQLADDMPVVVLQGTFSHDRQGSLEPLKRLQTTYPILVADKPGQWILQTGLTSVGVAWQPMINGVTFGDRDAAVFSCLPSLNKADPAVREHPQGPAGYVADLLAEWGEVNNRARADEVPTVAVSHGTVNGSITESDFAMVSPDHEFRLDTLHHSKAQATMVGHVHKHQSWQDDGRQVAYSGSIARLVHGHHDPVGFLMWDVGADQCDFEFVPTPARELVDITFDGPPDMDELRRLAADAGADHHVRIRYEIDQDHAHTIDKEAIRQMFDGAGDVRIEATVYPVQSVRASGIGRVMTLREKLGYWAATTGDDDRLDGLESRLEMLQTMDPDQVVDRLLGTDDDDKREAA